MSISTSLKKQAQKKMISIISQHLIFGFIGISSGVIVGTSLAAFLTVLDVIPRLAQLLRIKQKVVLETAITFGAVMGTLVTVLDLEMFLPSFIAIFLGLLMGVFVGMLTAALTEVLNVLPIIALRLGLISYVRALLVALILGKTIGSLLYWLLPQIQ
ncbi:stage V sporulation protein AB [Proteinivorax tanatarense]|uniref:Stage V sporulation protein AB n=1 Tax=Proteinivorax tanatarense TaxID=1260629 RepID=A0AAU7VPI0_9FIRM